MASLPLRALLLSLPLLLLAPSAAPSQCAGGTLPCTVVPAGPLHDGAGGPLLAGRVYVMSFGVDVPAGTTLTIQGGAIVKFTPSALPYPMSVNGTLVVQGTAQNPAIMTSHRDDSVGGDTNGDGGATSPAPGDWRGIELKPWSGSPQPNQISGLAIRYAGQSGAASFLVSASATTVSGCVVWDSAGPGMDLDRQSPVITGCAFIACTRPLVQVTLDAVVGLTGNVASGSTVADHFEVRINGGTGQILGGSPTWSPANTINQSGLLVMTTGVVVPGGNTFTLAPGLTLKFTSATALTVSGTLVADGTQAAPVVLTSVDDPTGGQTGSGQPAPGNWVGVRLNIGSSGNLLRHVRVRYAGAVQPGAGVTLQNAAATLDQTTISHSAGDGLRLAGSTAVVTGCAFDHNQAPVTGVPLADLPGFSGNTATGNALGDVMTLAGGTLSTSMTLGPQNALNPQGGFGTFVVAGSLTVSSTATLQFLPGLVLKMAGAHDIDVQGTLLCTGTTMQPVVVTAAGDAAFGTSIPGAPAPTPGAWGRILLNAAGSSLSGMRVRFGGAGGPAAVVANADVTLSGSVVERSLAAALHVSPTALPTVTACAFDLNGAPPVANVPLAALPGFTQCSATGNTGGDYLALGAASVATAIALDPANTLNQTGVVVLRSLLTILPQGTLLLRPGTILKFAGPHDLRVQGVLDGSAGGHVLTSLSDDAHGGDTANDGPTSGSPGEWGQLRIEGTGTATLFQTTVRYGGAGAQAQVFLSGTSPSLDQTTIEAGLGAGLGLGSTALPQVTGCTFLGNGGPAISGASFQAVQGFSGSTASGNGSDVIRIADVGAGDPVVGPTMSLGGTGVFAIPASLTLTGTLTLQAGVILKFDGPWIFQVTGVLLAQGTQGAPVVFTSIADDDHGGDSDGNGPSMGTPGDWRGLAFASGSDASVLRHTLIRYAGAGNAAAVELDSADITMDHVTIEKCLGDALDLNGSSNPLLTDCTFACNGGLPVAGLTWATLASMSGTTVYANAGGDAAWVTSDAVVGDLVIRRDSYFGSCVIVTVTPNAQSPNRLSFEGPVVIKAANPNVAMRLNQNAHVRGHATGKAVFTSINDDSVGGVTSQVPAAPGDWLGVESAFADDMLDAVVRYAGAGGHAGIEGTFSGVVGRCRVEHCAGDAFRVNAWDVFSSVAWNNLGNGFEGGGIEGATWLRWCTAVSNGGRGFYGDPGSLAISVGCNAWANASGNWPPLSATPWPAYAWRVFYSNGLNLGHCPLWTGGSPPNLGYCDTYGHENTNVDPQFVDLVNGDLRLQGTSPLRNRVPLSATFSGTGIPGVVFVHTTPTTEEFVKDYDGNPRILDDDFGGPAPFRSDAGAFERNPVLLDVSGEPRLGTTVTFTVQGPPAIAILGLGGGGDLFVPPLGFLLAAPDPAALLILGALPTGAPLPVPIPAVPALAGLEVAVQAYAVPTGQTQGIFSGVWEARLRP